MADNSTWVKIDRNITSWRWYQDANTLRVFLHLILIANIKDHSFEKITVHRGEVATSLPSLSSQLNISVRSVRTALEHLKSTGEVTARIYPHYQVITIVSYDRYQERLTGRLTGDRQAADRQLTGDRHQSKNDKNEKNEKNVCVTHTTPSADEVAAFFAERGRSRADAERFFAYNAGRGWMIGRTRIKDWRATAEMWIAGNADVQNTAADPHPELDDFGRPIKKEYV